MVSLTNAHGGVWIEPGQGVAVGGSFVDGVFVERGRLALPCSYEDGKAFILQMVKSNHFGVSAEMTLQHHMIDKAKA